MSWWFWLILGSLIAGLSVIWIMKECYVNKVWYYFRNTLGIDTSQFMTEAQQLMLLFKRDRIIPPKVSLWGYIWNRLIRRKDLKDINIADWIPRWSWR